MGQVCRGQKGEGASGGGGDVHPTEWVSGPRSRTQENPPVSQWDFVRKEQGAAGPGKRGPP